MRLIFSFSALVILCFTTLGCKPSDHDHDGDHDHGHEPESHSHGDDAKSFSGATHEEGQGITLLPETEERLGLQLAEVKEEMLSRQIEFTARVFSTGPNKEILASGWVPREEAKALKVGTTVQLKNATNNSLDGIVAKTIEPDSANETEVIIRVSADELPIGTFLDATAQLKSDTPVLVVPREAVIAGTYETFVYVQNDDAYLRTVVEPGRANGKSVEIKDGLVEGDQVVTRGALDLWLVELRAVKGGQGCCPAPTVKGKKSS